MDDSGANGVNIGNYKGVMLCNRPFNGSSSAMKAKVSTSSSEHVPFLAGLPDSGIGQNVPILNEPLHAIKRDKKNTALSKHKKWLHDLQKERQRLENALSEEEQKKEDRRRRFAEKEAKMRAEIRSCEEDGSVPEVDDEVIASKKSSKKQSRPMWAMTKESAEEESERKEEEELQDLIDFANELDIDQFMDDVEKKAKIDQVKQRMAQLNATVEEEEEEIRRALIQAERAENKGTVVALNANSLSKLEDDSRKWDEDDDVRSVASSVISECKSIRSVHSARSVAVLTKKARDKLSNLAPIAENNHPRMETPKVISHDEENGTRISKKNNPSNLPYIHRNPAI